LKFKNLIKADAMLEQLIPARTQFPVDDPIFSLNAEAQQRKAGGEDILNATLGALADDAGSLVLLETVQALVRELTPTEVMPYAPITGDPAFLRALVRRHWPKLDGFGTGCATPGGSGALAISVRNLLEPGMKLLTAAPFWGPYATLASENGAGVATAPFPEPGQPLDAEAWLRAGTALMERQKRLLVWLNEPCHNPTGRSLAPADREALMAVLRKLSDLGPVTLLLDCAYLDYTADPAHVRQALDQWAVLGEEGRVLVGASLSLSKALTLYGGRGGALVFPWAQDAALQAALSTSCRGAFSNCSRAAQSLLLRLERDGKRQETLWAEHRRWSGVLEQRALALDGALKAQGLAGAPWLGGFFIALKAADPVAVCASLKGQGVYVVPLPDGLRVGICGLTAAQAPRFAQAMAQALKSS
jgi:aspartate/tyrosine/aromatic aminotransferase